MFLGGILTFASESFGRYLGPEFSSFNGRTNTTLLSHTEHCPPHPLSSQTPLWCVLVSERYWMTAEMERRSNCEHSAHSDADCDVKPSTDH